MPRIVCGSLIAAVLPCIVASAEQSFLAANLDCKQAAICDAFCKESSLSKDGASKINSKKMAALALSLRDCGQSCACPFGQERMPPTPYPAPPLPPVPAGMLGSYLSGSSPTGVQPGDPRNGGQILIPAISCAHCPPVLPPLPPLPPVPLADFSTVGQRFLPRLVIPKGEVTDNQDLDYEGNPVPVNPSYNLPPGWKTMKFQGKDFWFNDATGEKSWIHPANPRFQGR